MKARIKPLLVALALLVTLVLAVPAPHPTAAASQATITVYPNHPRLIVGGYRGISVAQMQTRCADPAFQGECDNIGSTGHVDDEAMDYLLHDDTAAADAVVYALQHDSFTCSYERSNVGGYALAYDWAYNYISNQSVKDDIEDRLADCAVTISNTLGTNGPHLWHGYTSDAAAMALVALSLDHDSRRVTLLDAAERLFRGNALEGYAYVDGAWPEGISYLRSHFFSGDPPRQYVLDALHAWHSAVQEEDIYQAIANDEGDWLRRLGYFHVYHLLPPYGSQSEHTWTRHGDMPSWRPEPSNQHRPYTDAIADAYDDAYLQQIGAIIEDDWGFVSGQGSYHRIHRYALPTNLDPTLAGADFDTLATAAIFGRDTIGYVAMRSGWADDAALIYYRAGDWFTGHQHMDQGHFEIWRSGPLALDGGVYADWGTEHREAYYIRTVAHNSLLIRQPGESFAHGYGAGDTNDGGQRVQTYAGPSCAQCIQSVAEYESNVGAGQHYEAGDITAFIHTDDYDYVASDITPAYNSPAYTYGSNTPKVEIVQRELAYLRPNVVLVFDRVRSTDASYEKAWLLHSSTRPQTASETVVQGSADNGILTSDDDVFSVDNGSGGQLFVQTLLPAAHTMRKIGGTDYRYWSDGANRDGGASSHETGHAEPGLWRVEIVPDAAQTDDLFLHALYITATTASAMPSASLLTTSGGEMSGAHVQEPGRERVVLFSAAMDGATVAVGVQYDVTTSGECGHLLTGILSDTTYRITAGADEQTVTSSAEHTLYFTTTHSGALYVVIVPLGAPPVAVTDLGVVHAIAGDGTLTATLRWTAPTDAVTYTLRYSNTTISDVNWPSAVPVSVPFTASTPGSTEWLTAPVSYTGGPSASSGRSTVYFALKAQNDAGDWSGLSNNGSWPRFDVYLPLVLRQLEGLVIRGYDPLNITADQPADLDIGSSEYAGTAGREKAQWVEGTQAADDGATRDYYNRAARLAWDNYMGDWRDANDVAQGDAPYGTATLIDDNTPEYIEWDVTGLVQEWVDGTYPNKGLLARAVSGSGTFNFYSREHAIASQHPELVVVTASGTNTLAPQADVYLDTSTYQCLGDLDTLRISDSSPTLLRFDLSGIDNGTEITNATLRLYVYAEYGGATLDAGVFRCSQGHELPPSDPIPGLAAQYPHDQGIENHSDVHLFSDFETPDWGSDWTFGYDASTLETVTSDPEILFAPFQGTALRVEIPEGTNTGMSMGYDFADEIGQEPEEIYFRYYLRISDDWETTYGGKMPGISGTYGRAGWGGRPSDGTNGWSARGSFNLMPPPGNPLGETVPLGHYVYHADMDGIYGDVDLWQNDYRGYLEKNRWYCIEQYLRMNTLAQNDGILRAWVDGRLAYERTDWRWRDVDTLKIERIWMNVYHGGTATPDQDVHLYIDNVVIAKQYIGPMALDSLTLRGSPGNQSAHLTWTVNSTLPATSTWQITYYSQTVTAPLTHTEPLSATRAHTLTGLTNYTWYTVTLNGMLESTPFLTGTVTVMPTDIFVYLPLVLRTYSP